MMRLYSAQAQLRMGPRGRWQQLPGDARVFQPVVRRHRGRAQRLPRGLQGGVDEHALQKHQGQATRSPTWRQDHFT